MRVLVARPHAQAERTARRLRERGHDPVLAPVLVIRETGRPPPAGAFDAVLVTSRNAVPPFLRHRQALAGLPVLAVGAATGETLAAGGFVPAGIAAGDGASLAGLVAERLPAGASLLHVAGRDRRPNLAAALAVAGFTLAVWEAYEACAVERLPPAAHTGLVDGTLEAALHYSARSAGMLRGLAEAAGLAEAFGRLLHLCLSPAVAEALGAAPRIAIAPAPNEEALLGLFPVSGGSDRRAGSRSAEKRC